jgi:hypothetical protein
MSYKQHTVIAAQHTYMFKCVVPYYQQKLIGDEFVKCYIGV